MTNTTIKILSDMTHEDAKTIVETLKEWKSIGYERSDVIRKLSEEMYEKRVDLEKQKAVIAIYKGVMMNLHY